MTAIKPRTETVTIYQGDDLARLTELEEAYNAAERDLARAEKAAKNPGRAPVAVTLDEVSYEQDALLAARERRDEAAQEHDTFAKEAEARGVTVWMHHLPRKTWRALRAAHPPRDGDEEDATFDVNVDTMPDELLPKSIDLDKSTIDGPLEDFLESLSSYDYYNRLFMTALSLNVGRAGADPTLRLAFAGRKNSSGTLSSPSAPTAP